MSSECIESEHRGPRPHDPQTTEGDATQAAGRGDEAVTHGAGYPETTAGGGDPTERGRKQGYCHREEAEGRDTTQIGWRR